MIEAPYFAAGGGPSVSRSEFMERKYATAVLSVPDPDGRKRPEELALEIVHGIVETVEPGNWDTGEPVEPDDNVEGTAPRGAGGRPARRRIVQDWKIARIRQYRGQVIITAPDFVHRQVGGYPQKIVPTPLTDAARETRSAQASAHDAITITVLAPGEEMSE
jgi:hypothetical protein